MWVSILEIACIDRLVKSVGRERGMSSYLGVVATDPFPLLLAVNNHMLSKRGCSIGMDYTQREKEGPSLKLFL